MVNDFTGRERSPLRVALLSPGGAIRAGLRALLQSGDRINITDEMGDLTELQRLDESVEVLVAVLSFQQLSEVDQLLPKETPMAVLLLLMDWGEVVPAPLPPVFHDRAIGLLPLGVEAETLQAALAALVEGLSVGLPAWFNRVGSSTVSEWGLPVGEERLTRREVEVLEQLAQGLTNKQIARTLGISEHTVKYHISAIYAKLGVMNRAEAVRVGARRGYVQI
ncbi:MAG: helix-turn-helix transcriptional regulator [Bellilinea sp.]|nr:MAG: helix-turn-helix transcriptional regulator [Bellilinea sp.]